MLVDSFISWLVDDYLLLRDFGPFVLIFMNVWDIRVAMVML
jgi:hypothetical protein